VNPPARFAPQARTEIANALDFLAENPVATQRLRSVVAAAASRIGRHPFAGRRQLALADERYRCWSVQAFPYRIVYRPTFTPPLIVRMVNTARDLGPLLARLAEGPEEGLPKL